MALAVIDVLAEYAIIAYLKWPNDVLIQGRKISGILSESHNRKLILGVGFNLFLDQSFYPIIKKPAIALSDLLETIPDRNAVLLRILHFFRHRIKISEDQKIDDLVTSFQRVGYKYNQFVRFHIGRETFRIKIKGINSMGHLIAEKENGETMEIVNGELIDE